MASTASTDQAQIDCFNAEAKATKEIKIVVKNIIELDNLVSEGLHLAVVEGLQAETLFTWENMDASGAVGCRIPRDLLVYRGVQYVQPLN
jgi:hypothetical protein